MLKIRIDYTIVFRTVSPSKASKRNELTFNISIIISLSINLQIIKLSSLQTLTLLGIYIDKIGTHNKYVSLQKSHHFNVGSSYIQ